MRSRLRDMGLTSEAPPHACTRMRAWMMSISRDQNYGPPLTRGTRACARSTWFVLCHFIPFQEMSRRPSARPSVRPWCRVATRRDVHLSRVQGLFLLSLRAIPLTTRLDRWSGHSREDLIGSVDSYSMSINGIITISAQKRRK